MVGSKALQHAFRGDLDMIRAAVLAAESLAGIRVDVMAELGGNHDVFAERSQGFADEFLIPERAIVFRGVEEGNAVLDGGADDRDHLVLVRLLSVGVGHAHAAEPDGGDLEAAIAECALLHLSLPVLALPIRAVAAAHLRYCSSVTFSIQSTTLPFSAS